MARSPLFDDPGIFLPESIYDTTDQDEEPWFSGVDIDDDEAPTAASAGGKDIFETTEWMSAQNDLSVDLASAAFVQGRLSERLDSAHDGLLFRLALHEVGELGWWSGGRIPVDRLALFIGLRLGNETETQSLTSASWAVRRLASAARPSDTTWEQGLAHFLGFEGDKIASLSEVMGKTASLHPITQAAILMHAWRIVGEGRAAVEVEAAVMASKHAATQGFFMPLALAGGTALRGQGSPRAKLAAFYRGVEQAGLSALMLIKRVSDWRANALEVLSDKAGRTPPALVQLLTEWPTVTAPFAEEKLNTSRAAIQRNLEYLEECNLTREMTGQDRYRVWTAKL